MTRHELTSVTYFPPHLLVVQRPYWGLIKPLFRVCVCVCVCVCERARARACVGETGAIFASRTITLISWAQTRSLYAPCNFIVSCSPLGLLLFYSEMKWNVAVMKHLFQTIYYNKYTRQLFVSMDFI